MSILNYTSSDADFFKLLAIHMDKFTYTYTSINSDGMRNILMEFVIHKVGKLLVIRFLFVLLASKINNEVTEIT